MRLVRLLFYGVVAAILWSYFSDSAHVSNMFNNITPINSLPWGKIQRFINLNEAVKAKFPDQNNNCYVQLQDIPLTLQQAIIATEDTRFYQHHGIDLGGIVRAAFTNLQNRQFSEGGSTITQQLVKNLFLTQEKTISRKIEEVILAIDMEFHFSKAEILEMYLNQIYYGSGAYGFVASSKVYFDKEVRDLTLAETSILAGLPQAPSIYSPYANLSMAKQRQSAVLDLMVKQGFISPHIAEMTKKEPLYFAK